MKEGRRKMQEILTRDKKAESNSKPLTPVESFYKKVIASKRMSKRIDRSISRSYVAIARAIEKQIYDGDNK